MSLLEKIDKFIHKRILHSSTDNDMEFIEPDEIRRINNVIAAPAPTVPPKLDEGNKEAKQ